MNKRFLIFSIAYCPYWGGAELAVKEITDRASDLDFDLITPRYNSKLPKYEKYGNVNIYRIGFGKKDPKPEELLHFPLYFSKIIYPFIAFLKAVSLNRKHNYYKLWAIMSYAGFPAVFFKMFYKDIPLLLTLQEGDPIEHIKDRKRIKLIYPLYKKIFRSAESVQAISGHLSKFANDMGYRGEVGIIPNGIDIGIYSGRTAGWPRNAEEVRLITTSRLVKKNAVDDIIKSLSYLPTNIKLSVLGSGPLEGELKHITEKLNLNDRVKFLGFVEPQKIPAHLAGADIFIRPSLSEGLGSSFIEAMAAGLPVIATPVGGITDFLIDGKTGFYCKTDNPENISEKVKFILDKKNVDIVRKVIDDAMNLAVENYNWDIISKKMADILIN